MRYPPDHKRKARERILDAAAMLFRRNGYDGVGIDTLMAEAGLTRGAFYAHFRSKRDLFTYVMRRDGDFNYRMRNRRGGTDEELLAATLEVVDGYLGPENLDSVAHGCQMAALSIDAARSAPAARRAYDKKLRDLQREFMRGMPVSGDANPSGRALSAIAQCVGAVIMANACDDDTLKRQLLAAARTSARSLLTSV